MDDFVWHPEDVYKHWHILKPYCDSDFPCGECGRPYSEHAWLPKGQTGHLICPGMTLTRIADEYYPARVN